jgi:tetratricopeptide (TPR) repeat protein
LSEAESLVRQALAIFEGAYGPDHVNVASALCNLASLLRTLNRGAEAEPLLRRAIAIDERSYGPEHPDVSIRLNNLADWLWAMKRGEEAEPLLRRALAINSARFINQRHVRFLFVFVRPPCGFRGGPIMLDINIFL